MHAKLFCTQIPCQGAEGFKTTPLLFPEPFILGTKNFEDFVEGTETLKCVKLLLSGYHDNWPIYKYFLLIFV